jgi:predicted nucleotidyltransferase
MNTEIEKNRQKLINLFSKHKVKRACIFGSATSDRFTGQSDINLLISFHDGLDPLESGELWWSLYDELKILFRRNVDLVTEKSLKNPYFIQEVDNTKQLIYG